MSKLLPLPGVVTVANASIRDGSTIEDSVSAKQFLADSAPKGK